MNLVLCLVAVVAMAPAPSRPVAAPRLVRIHGVPTLQVGGRPLLVMGAQCDIWRSTRQDAATEAFFEGYARMHATTVSVGIPWSNVEALEGQPDFTFMDWFVARARRHNLRLVLNLFNTNVCGKVAEVAPNGFFPQYAPSWMLDHPEAYQRMVLPTTWRYAGGGPPMCPNDPRTLAAEKRYVAAVARHLRDTDPQRTVVMLQLDNEFYYQQWEGQRPAYGSAEEKAVRCTCRFCEAKWAAGKWPTAEAFMFGSMAAYAQALAQAVASEYPIPVYLNSPWWSPETVAIFLRGAPGVAFVGIDGAFTTVEPNVLTQSQVDRNLVFAAECPTEQMQTRMNLDVLPYYTVIGRMGIGNLLWECGPPLTVVDDAPSAARYGAAMGPVRDAMEPIALARNTRDLVGWTAVRHISDDAKPDAHGNPVPGSSGAPVVGSLRTRVREGAAQREVDGDSFTAQLGPHRLSVSGAPAGIVLRQGPGCLVVVGTRGRVAISGVGNARALSGRFVGGTWKATGTVPLVKAGGEVVLELAPPGVVRITW